MMTQDVDLITLEEAAKRFRVPIWTLRYWIGKRAIASYKPELGMHVLVDANELERKTTPRKRPARDEESK